MQVLVHLPPSKCLSLQGEHWADLRLHTCWRGLLPCVHIRHQESKQKPCIGGTYADVGSSPVCY